MKPLVFLELNEINFEYLEFYIIQGFLPNFKRFIEEKGYYQTVSEKKYDQLEPWIQWVSMRTGKGYSEHQVYRLGDIVNEDLEQWWEVLERKGVSVAAVSPINAANRTMNSDFWIPDPWVETPASGDPCIKKLTMAIKQAVNDNTGGKLDTSTKLTLIQALLTKTKLKSWLSYLRYLLGAFKRQHWSKAMILDRLLSDIYIKLWRRHEPDFSTLFLNGAAHIQHHYLYNSKAYSGEQKNPAWYISENKDPILEVYKLYDDILGEALNLNVRVMVGTGLQQIPYERTTFYYRLKNHGEFLDRLGISYKNVSPRMSRDFVISFNDKTEALEAEKRLSDLIDSEGKNLFDIDNREDSLFVILSYPDEIVEKFSVYSQNSREKVVSDFSKDVSFVAIKNAHHDGTGYFMDSDNLMRSAGEKQQIPIKEVFSLVQSHFLAEKEPYYEN